MFKPFGDAPAVKEMSAREMFEGLHVVEFFETNDARTIVPVADVGGVVNNGG